MARWWPLATGAAIVALLALRFCFLSADFPNYTVWMSDQAKFTDEGWWASGAVSHRLLGHWQVAGDYNPAAALPVWPLMLDGLFSFTGVSVVAARALSVAFSIGAMGLAFLLVRRYSGGRWRGATWAMLVLAASPFGFVFSRLAILESPVSFEFCLALTLASLLGDRRVWPKFALPLLIATMLLTKTTSAVLLPAVLWLAWRAIGSASYAKNSEPMHRRAAGLLAAFTLVGAIPAILAKTYAIWVSAAGYGDDFHSFFGVNAYSGIDLDRIWPEILNLLRNGFWIDPVLYPMGIAALAISALWMRELWRNPLYTACWIAIASQASYILSRQDEYAPRYFLWLLVPLALATAMALDAVAKRSRLAFAAGVLALLASVGWNAIALVEFTARRTYQFRDAASGIRRAILSDPRQTRLLVGVSGSQLSLMTGIPSISDAYGTEDMAEKLQRYKPGWCAVWNGAVNPDVASLFEMEKVASYRVFDDDDRNTLILYKLTAK